MILFMCKRVHKIKSLFKLKGKGSSVVQMSFLLGSSRSAAPQSASSNCFLMSPGERKNNHMAMHDSFFFFLSFLPSAPSQLNPPAAALPDLNLSNCDKHLSHLFCSLRKKKKILKLDYTQTKREAL